MLKKDTKFEWTDDCQKAFETLKKKLCSPKILKYPDFNKPFILTTDASNIALGAVLSQGEIGKDLPISYASKSLQKHDLNKAPIEKELLAIHWGIQFFRPYLYGRRFTVVTDHRPLVSLFSHTNPSSKLTRIRLDLSDYDFDIIYKKGTLNTNADALSRININSDILKSMIPTGCDNRTKRTLIMTRSMKKNNTGQMHQPNIVKTDHLYMWDCLSLNDIKNMRKLKFEFEKDFYIKFYNNNVHVGISDNSSNLDLLLKKLISKMEKENIKELALGKNEVIFEKYSPENVKKAFNKIQKEKKNPQLKIIMFMPPQKVNDVIEQYKLINETHSTAHLGIRKTVVKLKQKYCWKNMTKMVKKFVNGCEICAKNKQTKHIKEAWTITDTPSNSFEVVSIDTVGPLRISNDYRYILTMQCELTKYVIACPIKTKEARTIAETMIEQLYLKYGHIKIIKSDRGTEFVNEVMKNICNLLNIEHKFSAPYHHETIGSLERNHRVMNEFFLTSTNSHEWDKWLPYYTFSYNTTPHIDTGYTPFELIYGKLPADTRQIISNKNISYDSDSYYTELRTKLQFSLNKAKEFLEKAKQYRTEKSNNNTNPLNLKQGDLVLVK